MTQRIETETCIFELRDDGILYCTTKPDAREEHAQAEQNVAAIDKLCAEKHWPMLSDIRNLRSQSREARALYAASPIATAVALIVPNPVSRVIGSFYLGLNKPSVPTKLFKSEAEARVWLAEHPGIPRSTRA